MKILRITFLLLFFTQLGISQNKSASISGDAATLINLLDKNYNIVDDDFVQEIIIDQQIVLGIFNSYINIPADKQIENINPLNFSLQKLINDLDNEKDSTKKKRIEEEIKRKKVKILTKLSVNTSRLFENNIENNTYLEAIHKRFKGKYDALSNLKIDPYKKYNTNGLVQKSIPFLSSGNIGFETFVEVLKEHIIEQVKAELSNFVIENVKEKLENPNYYSIVNELKILLPNTYSYIIQFKVDEMSDFTSRVKENIETDLNNLLENATNLTQSSRFKHLVEKNPDLRLAFQGLNIVVDLSSSKNPIGYFDTLQTSDLVREWSDSGTYKEKNIANTIKLMNLLAHSLTIANEEGVNFVSVDFMSSYGTRPEFFLLYFGFLHQQNKNIYNISFSYKDAPDPITIKINELFTKIKPDDLFTYNTDAIQIQNQLTSIVKNAEKIHQNIKEIKKAGSDDTAKITPQQTHSFVNDFIGFIDQVALVGIDLTYKMQTEGEEISLKTNYNNIKPYINTAKKANDIVLSLNEKKYANAVLTALKIPEELSSDKYTITQLLNLSDKLESIEPLYLSYLVLKDSVEFPNKKSDKAEFKYLLKNLELSINNYDLKKEVIKNTITTKIKELENTLDKKEENFKTALDSLRKTMTDDLIKNYTDNLLLVVNNKLPEFQSKKFPKLKDLVNAKIKEKLNIKLEDSTSMISFEKEAKKELLESLPNLVMDIAKIDDENISKIIYFLGDVANAEDKEDLKLAFSNYTTKEGYRKKRNAAFDVSINSFPGFYGGSEFSKFEKNGTFVTGISIPVGINTSFYSTNDWFQSIDLYISIFDVAAPFRLRIDNDENTKTVSDYTFENIFTPGIYLSFPIRKSPFALNIGVQYGPQLSFKEDIDDFAINKESYSIRAGLVVDIPLFTLYNRPKSR